MQSDTSGELVERPLVRTIGSLFGWRDASNRKPFTNEAGSFSRAAPNISATRMLSRKTADVATFISAGARALRFG
jgi:hypothetical protein